MTMRKDEKEKGALGIALLVWLFGGGLGVAFVVFILLKMVGC